MKRALSPSLMGWRGPSSPSLARPRTDSQRSISPSLLPRPPPLPIKHLVVIHVQTATSLRAPLFPADEKTTIAYMKQHGKRNEYRVSEVDCDGRMFADCSNCTRGRFLDIIQFAPPDNLRNSRFRPAFFDALQSYSVAYDQGNIEEARKWRKKVEELRNGQCPSCQKTPGYLSPADQACKDEYNRMRKEACTRNDGCANPDCVERGDQAWCVLQGDHIHTANDPNPEKRKTWRLSDYTFWSGHGGVPAMRAEEAKEIQWSCGFCHALEKTGKQANRYPNPLTMPDGKSKGTPEEVAQYYAKRHAVVTYPKRIYVDVRKRSIGCCLHCKRSDVAGQEWAFHWDHLDESTKMKGTDTLAGKNGGVCGLVANSSPTAALDAPGFRAILDEEMAKCDLLCTPCHHRKTNHYPPRVL